MLKVLVVEDDRFLRDIIEKNLTKNGYDVLQAENGKIGIDIYENQHIDLIITDIMMPVMDGNKMVKSIRYTNPDIPIIMLTALDAFLDKEKGFTSGTDDYLVKPVNMQELILRVKALLRRSKINNENQLIHKDIKLEHSSKQCFIGDTPINLTVKEFELLFKLLSSPNQIFTRDQLMDEIWGYDSESYTRTVDTHIKRIREKVVTNSFEIKTVRGLGYKVVLS